MSISAMGVPKVANDLQYTLLLDDTRLKQVWCRCHPVFFFSECSNSQFGTKTADFHWKKKLPSSWASSKSAFRAAIKPNLAPSTGIGPRTGLRFLMGSGIVWCITVITQLSKFGTFLKIIVFSIFYSSYNTPYTHISRHRAMVQFHADNIYTPSAQIHNFWQRQLIFTETRYLARELRPDPHLEQQSDQIHAPSTSIESRTRLRFLMGSGVAWYITQIEFDRAKIRYKCNKWPCLL